MSRFHSSTCQPRRPGTPSAIRGALDERQGNRLFRRNSEYRAQQHQAGLLGSERARDRKCRSANCMQEAFDDDRLGDADRGPHEREHDRNFGHADEPSRHMHGAARDQGGSGRVDHGQVLIDGVNSTEQAPLPVTGQAMPDRP